MACAFLSIDQEKAFDYVDWGFLDRILGTMNCIVTNSYGLVKVIDVFNNMVEHPERGLIQRNQSVFGSVGGVLVLIHPVV